MDIPKDRNNATLVMGTRDYITKVMFCQNIVSQTAQCPFYFVNFQKVDYGSQNT